MSAMELSGPEGTSASRHRASTSSHVSEPTQAATSALTSSRAANRASFGPNASSFGQLGALHGPGQPGEHVVVRAGDGDPATVARAVVAVRQDVDRVGPHPLPDEPELLVRRRELVEHAEDRLVQREVDALPGAGRLAGPERQEHPDHAVEPGDVVGQGRRARRDRWTVGLAGQVGEARERVGDPGEAGQVAVRARLAVGRHPDEDHPRVQLLHRLVVEAPPLEHPGPEVLDHDVDLGDELAEDLAPLRRPEVEGDRPLVAALAEPHQRVAAVGPGAEAAEVVPGARSLDLDDVGTELTEHRRAVRPGDVGAEVEHPDAVKCLHVARG